jgi:integrase
MPKSAIPHVAVGMLKIPNRDRPGVATALLANNDAFALLTFDLADKPGLIFVPNESPLVNLDRFEVVSTEVEALRASMALMIDPKRLKEAKVLHKASLNDSVSTSGRKAHERLSTALSAYIANRVRQDVAMESEIKRIQDGCALLIELEGDLTLAEIDSERLRHFRDHKLSKVPANENKIRLIHKTTSVSQSISAVAELEWPVMSVPERNKRMRWIGAWFKWLHEADKWIAENPAASLHGESVLSRAERRKLKNTRRDDEARDAFTQADLKAIFSAPWFVHGKGELTKQGTFRTYSPMRYWLPLLGLFTGGGRINEVCQLHLEDIRQDATGAWFADFNEESVDQNLKTTPSKRKVPLHPTLLDLGFDKWHAALVSAGYTRLFPELKLDTEKGYGKAATKWFTSYMASLGIARDGRKVFHSFRHTYTNALPDDTPERVRRQLTGHIRGKDVHDKTYRKDVEPAVAAQYVNRLAVTIPPIAPFNIDAGLKAILDALKRKNRGQGATEDVGEE